MRVPSENAILTNGITFSSNVTDTVICELSIEEDRAGYDYLMVTPLNFAPSAAITKPEISKLSNQLRLFVEYFQK